MVLNVPNTNIDLHPGDIIRIGRFSEINYEVQYGWYTWGGNRPVCGWSLRDLSTGDVKPLQLIDLTDMYMITHGPESTTDPNSPARYSSGTVYKRSQLLYLTYGELYQATRDFIACDEYSSEQRNFDTDVEDGNIVRIARNQIVFDTFFDFPAIGEEETVYVDESAARMYLWDPSTTTYVSLSDDIEDYKEIQSIL